MAGNYSVGMSPMDTAYFMQAMQTPTPYGAYQGYGAYPTYTAPADKTYVAQPQVVQPAALAAAAEPVEEKNSSAGTALGVIGTVGAAALCIAGFKKGNVNKKGLARVWDGVCGIVKGGLKGKASREVSTIRQNNGKTVVTLPGKKNVMLQGEGLDKIGVTTKPSADKIFEPGGKPGELTQGCKLHRFVDVNFKTTPKAKSYTILGKHDGSYVVTNSNGKVITELSNKERTAIEKRVNAIRNGEIDLTTLHSATIRQTDGASGTIHQFVINGNAPAVHRFSASNYFPLDHARVDQACLQNGEAYRNIIEKARKSDFKGIRIGDGSTVKLPGVSGLKSCTVDRNGKILTLTTTGGKTLQPETPEYATFVVHQKEAIEKAINATNKEGGKVNWDIVYEAKAA